MTSLSNPNVVAVCGGPSVNHLGSAAKVVAFFDCVRRFAADALSPAEQHLILDRLYKRYLRNEEVEPALAALQTVRRRFAEVPSSRVEWAVLGVPASELPPSLLTLSLAEVWQRLFEHIEKVGGSALYFAQQEGPPLPPMRLCRADFGSLDREDKRPLAEYDALDGPPFWLEEPPPPVPAPSYKDGKVVPHGTPGSTRPDYMASDGTSATFVAGMNE